MPSYSFKVTAEFWWFVFVTAVVSVLQVLVVFDPAKVADWKTWVIALGAGALRAAAGAALSYIGVKKLSSLG